MKYFWLLILLTVSLSLFSQNNTIISGESSTKKITVGEKPKTQSVKALPNLIIKNEAFRDANGNNAIDGGEKSAISFKISNIGNGEAKNVKVNVTQKNEAVAGLTFDKELIIGNIKGDETRDVSVGILSDMDVSTSMADFKIEVIEAVGFDAYPLEMRIETRKFEEPLVKVTDAVFSTEDGGKIQLNYPITLKVIVQNVGKGEADDVKVAFSFPMANCVVLGENDNYTIGKLKRGESKTLEFLFTATRRYSFDQISVNIDISEKYQKFAQDTVVNVGLTQNLLATNKVTINSVNTEYNDIKIASLKAETDRNIPENPTKYPNRFALIIGNEDYNKYQKDLKSEVNVAFAANDASVFGEYATKTMGVPESNIFLLLNATSNQISQKLDLVSKLLEKTGETAELIFYYAGHGLPDPNTKEAYILPVDANGTDLQFAIKLEDVYKTFSSIKAARMTFYIDACFSGGGREAALLTARSVRIKPELAKISGNTVVFSASTGEQSAMPYTEKQHGLFTYFLLKKLQDNKGDISYDELFKYTKNEVSLKSLMVNQKEQDPTVQVSPDIENTWKLWKIK